MTIEMLPLNQLVPSQTNVRKTNVLAGIEELAASIEAHGLLQNLQVRAAARGKFEVVAGGRRLAAMNILRRQKKLAKDFPVPCHIIDEAIASEISLAENTVRLAMHPADQFTAFHALAEQGMGIEDIAARFGVSPVVVRQRLKLASVSPILIDVYREGDMTLEQLMAFTVNDDHAAQEAAWFDCPSFRRDPRSIRATLTEAQVESDDSRVLFVGLEAYLAAGGGMNRDLFQPEHEGYLTDSALLDRLVNAKLSAAAEEIRGEGWAWIEIMPSRSLAGYGRVQPVSQMLDTEAQQRRDTLMTQYDALIAEHGDEPEPDIAAEIDDLWQEIEAIELKGWTWQAEDMARCGAVLSLDYNGNLTIDRGLVRPDDVRKHHAEDSTSQRDEGARPNPSGLSAALVESLTAERTAALRAMLMDNQPVALAGLCHALGLSLFYRSVTAAHACLQIRLTSRDLAASADTIESSRAGMMMAERHGAWEARLPESADELFGWLLTQDVATLLEFLTFCAANSIDAVRGKSEWARNPRLNHADAVAEALRLDMREWWSPTKANYLGRVSKSIILDAVREGVSPQASDNLATLKKAQLAESAEQRLAGTGWLPPLLRTPVVTQGETETGLQQAA